MHAATGFDINTADAAALAAELPGIGPVKAARIVEHRRTHGPFVDLDSLIAVPGIGPKTLEGIRRHIGGRSPPSGGERLGESGDVGALRGRDERGGGDDRGSGESEGGHAGAAPPRSTSELEAETRFAVRALIELARTDAARRAEVSDSPPPAAAQ